MSLTVRDELAHAEVGDADERRAEAAALCHHAGSLHVRGGDGPHGSTPCWVVATASGAVARRLHRTLVVDVGVRPAIEVHQPSGLRRTTEYRLVVDLDAGTASASPLPLLDVGRRPLGGPPPLPSPAQRRGWLRGAAMANLSVSAPGQPAHLELTAPNAAFADTLVALLGAFGAPSARSATRTRAAGTPTGGRDTGVPGTSVHRVVVKSGAQMGEVLAALGAHHAFLQRDLRRLERGLRSEANRAANADRANLDRATRAAARQVAAVRSALAVLPHDVVSADVHRTARVRVAHPGASLGEIGALLDPPVGRATVHRRLARLLAMARDADAPPGPATQAP